MLKISIVCRKVVAVALLSIAIAVYGNSIVANSKKLRVYKTPNPLYLSLLDSSKKRNQKWNDSIIWSNQFRDYAFYTALQTGLSYLPSKYWQDMTKADIHLMKRGIISNPGKCIVRGYQKIYLNRFGKAVKQAEKHKAPKCVFYAWYEILGKDAQGNSGTLINQSTGWFLDPINASAYIENVMLHLDRYKGKVWAVLVGDELIFHVEKTGMKIFKKRFDKSPSPFMKKCYEEIKNKYGFGKFSIPYNLDKKHPDYPFCMRAYRSWLIDRCNQIFKKLKTAIKKKYPNVAIISQDSLDNHKYPEVDFENWNQYADIATFQLAVGTTPYSQYSMYLTKLVKDLSGLKRLMCIPHDFADCCYMKGGSPKEMQELYSQVIRGGVTAFHFWPGAYLKAKPYAVSVAMGFPYSWNKMMDMAKFIKTMPPLKQPKKSKTLIIRANDTLLTGDVKEQTLYAFTQIGQNAGGWFKFATDTQILNSKVNLKDYKIVYIVNLKYSRPELARKLIKFVKNGGILVCADPLVFERNINSESMTEFRGKLFNVQVNGVRKKASKITLENNQQIKTYKDSYNVKITSPKAKVIAKFIDGSPAIIMNRLGNGKAYYFATQPFNRMAIRDKKWRQFSKSFHVKIGGEIGYNIWRFKLPDKLFPAIPPNSSFVKGNLCLTGNFAFWDKSILTEGKRFNVNASGNYTIEKGGQKKEFSFENGPLTNRLQSLTTPKKNSYMFVKKFDKDKWSENFEGGKKVSICFDFKKTYVLNVLRVYFNAKLPPLIIKTSTDRKAWSIVARTSGAKTVDTRDVTFKDIKLKNNKKARYLEIEMGNNFKGTSVFVEVEVWGTE
jgi:Beta-galactosidase trimerisation domain